MASTPASSSSRSQGTLKSHLVAILAKDARGKREFEVSVLRSNPKRSYSLFPWASDPTVKIFQEHTLVILSELADKPADSPTAGEEREKVFVPVFGLEIAVYTVPSTSTALLYVSKIDTTGVLGVSAPSRLLTRALLQYYLCNPPHDVASLRVHVFARAQDQYLFPGSIDNKGKRVLDDKGLCKWWRSVLGEAAAQTHSISRESSRLQLFYLLGGCNYLESLSLLSAAPALDSPDAPKWVYGHPYSTVPPAVPTSTPDKVMLSDLIPAFQDDPKSRYLTSLTSSRVPAAGEEGDYDDVMEQLHKLSSEGSSATLSAMSSADVESHRKQERDRLLGAGMSADEWWECMGGRQECCAGHVAGFFVVVCDKQSALAAPAASSKDDLPKTEETPALASHPVAAKAALSHSTYVKLWSAVHNVNYNSFAKAAEAYRKWKEDLRHAVLREGGTEDTYATEVFGAVKVENAASLASANGTGGLKRQEPPKTVTTLQVKKKKKVTPASEPSELNGSSAT